MKIFTNKLNMLLLHRNKNIFNKISQYFMRSAIGSKSVQYARNQSELKNRSANQVQK